MNLRKFTMIIFFTVTIIALLSIEADAKARRNNSKKASKVGKVQKADEIPGKLEIYLNQNQIKILKKSFISEFCLSAPDNKLCSETQLLWNFVPFFGICLPAFTCKENSNAFSDFGVCMGVCKTKWW